MGHQNNDIIYSFDKEKVNRLKHRLASEDMESVVQLFKILADEKRAKVIFALCQENELCVGDIANIIEASIATTSHHLRTLAKMGIVTYRRERKLAFYSIKDEMIKALITIVLGHGRAVKLQERK